VASTISGFDAFLKTYFDNRKIDDLTKRDKPFYGRIATNEAVGADGWKVPLWIGNPQGIASKSLSNAQANATNVKGVAFSITNMAELFSKVDIGDKVIRGSRSNMLAFLQNQKTEIEGLYTQHSQEIAIQMWRNGGGAVGTVASTTSTTITLSTPQDASSFELNEFIQACQDDGTNTSTTPRVGKCQVLGIDHIGGVLTVDATSNITSLTAGDSLFRDGTCVANTGTLLMTGVAAYVTLSTTPGSLWGVTRTTDVVRLSGSKLPASASSGLGIEERIQQLAARMAGSYNGMIPGGDYCVYLHPEDFYKLNISAQGKGIRKLEDSKTQIGYDYIEFVAGGRTMKVFQDVHIPYKTGYILRMDNWVLGSLGGPVIQTSMSDGLQMLRLSTTMDYEYRIVSYINMSSNAPGASGVFVIN
jgi:hypothetical protein